MWTLPLASPEHCRHKLSVLRRIKKIYASTKQNTYLQDDKSL